MAKMSKMSKKKKGNKAAADEDKQLKKKKKNTILKRKQMRMDKKKAKKQKTRQFLEEKFHGGKRRETAEDLAGKPGSGGESSIANQVAGPKEKSTKKRKLDSEEARAKSEKRKMKKLKKEQLAQRKQQLLLANKQEEKHIKQLEKQLGLNRRKSKKLPKSFQDDGLDYILNACDSEGLENLVESEDEDENSSRKKRAQESDSDNDDLSDGADMDGQDEEGSDEEMDFMDEVMGGEEDDVSDQEDFDENDMNGTGMSDEHSEEEQDDLPDNNEENNNDIDEDDDFEDDQGSEEDDMSAKTANQKSKKQPKAEVWEDIYGRLRNSKGDIIQANGQHKESEISQSVAPGKYVPPALRKQMLLQPDEKKQKELDRLKKQVKGALNRLAESNMHSIANTIENLYNQNSRNDMNQTLTNLILQSVTGDVLTPDRLVMEHCMLIAILHANIGCEVGAHILLEIVKLYSSTYSGTNLMTEEGKRLENLLQIVGYIYSFNIVGSRLIFDILQKLVDSFKPKDIELILLVLRVTGFVIRKDDPGELKSFILKVQSKACEADASQNGENSRIKFMLDILMAVKNNNVNKIPNYDPSHFEHLKKTLKSYIRDGNFVSELKLGLKDLLEADVKGKWWIVGSAFAGKLVDGTDEDSNRGEPKNKSNGMQFSQKLLELARKMRMNTDQRRHIFCLILSSEDYLEATERIVKLGTKNQRERDSMFVLIDCALQEKKFNPFYSQVVAKLSTIDRKYKLAAQFSLWDKIRLTGSMKETQVDNLGRFIAHLVREKSHGLGILKIIEFAEMTKQNVRLLRVVFCETLLMKKENELAQIFQMVADNPKLSMFREGVRLYFHHFLLKQKSKLDPSINYSLLKERVQTAESILSSATSLKL